MEEVWRVTDECFSRSDLDDPAWMELFSGDLEGYAYHLAFAEAGIEHFDTGYLAVWCNDRRVGVFPYFLTDYRLDATVQGRLKRFSVWLGQRFPRLFVIRLACLGSPVTDSLRFGMASDWRGKSEPIRMAIKALQRLGEQHDANLIGCKDLLDSGLPSWRKALSEFGFERAPNMPVATNSTTFASIDDYFASLSRGTRRDLRRKYRHRHEISIEEFDGEPPDLEAIHHLYLNCFMRSELQFERLTTNFFQLVSELLPGRCRYVLYRAEGRLFGFNLLLCQEGVLIDKYIGMDYDLSRRYCFYDLSWLHNMEMCVRDGFHTYQSGQAAYAAKLRRGARLEKTWIYFRHRHWWIHQLLRIIVPFLSYENFDPALSNTN
ncbi:putative GNAT family N-acetyltransferase [Gammaproteobacteria bacterium]